jgi:glycosyltransferase involved in cell wall biosynthesis
VREAQFFLAFLPFPRQWSWLLKVEKQYPEVSEVRDFLQDEEQTIVRKLMCKSEKNYKLRHFCQVLKHYRGPSEKGILRIFSMPYIFTGNGNSALMRMIGKRYVVYAEPCMGVVYRHLWWRYFATFDDPCIIGANSSEDRFFLDRQEGVESIVLAHGDFLENDVLVNGNDLKDHDIAFNATYDEMPRKRHALMLDLLQSPPLRTKRVLFLGRGQESNVNRFQDLVKQMRLENRVTVLANLKRKEVPEQLHRCRMGVHLSLFENGCRCIYEFLRSDLPVVISSCTSGTNAELINPQTGLAVPDAELAPAIASVLDDGADYRPRRWFLDYSGSDHSSRRISRFFQHFFGLRGYSWEEDIVGLASSGANRYVSAADYVKFRADFAWLLECLVQWGRKDIKFSMD